MLENIIIRLGNRTHAPTVTARADYFCRRPIVFPTTVETLREVSCKRLEQMVADDLDKAAITSLLGFQGKPEPNNSGVRDGELQTRFQTPRAVLEARGPREFILMIMTLNNNC